MSSYVIVTDTGLDIPAKMAEAMGLDIIPLKVLIAGKEFSDTVSSLDIKNGFYDMLRQGVQVSTSSPNIDDFERHFKNILEHGKDILYIGFSSALSGTFNVARIVSEQLCEEYPERKIKLVDSLCGSGGQALLAHYCYMKMRSGATLEEAYDYAEKLKMNICLWFTVDDLNYLKKGGRISAATAVLGSVMNIRPVLKVNNEGKLQSVYKARGKRLAIAKMVEQMGQNFDADGNDIIFISHADCADDADLLARSVKKNYGIEKIVITEIGPSLGAHSGPGALALFYVGAGR